MASVIRFESNEHGEIVHVNIISEGKTERGAKGIATNHRKKYDAKFNNIFVMTEENAQRMLTLAVGKNVGLIENKTQEQLTGLLDAWEQEEKEEKEAEVREIPENIWYYVAKGMSLAIRDAWYNYCMKVYGAASVMARMGTRVA